MVLTFEGSFAVVVGFGPGQGQLVLSSMYYCLFSSMCFVSFSRWHYINLFFFFFFEKPALYKPIYDTCKCVLFIIFLFLISSSHPPQPKGVPKRCAKKEKERKKSLSLSQNEWVIEGNRPSNKHVTFCKHLAHFQCVKRLKKSYSAGNVPKDSKSHILPQF